MRLTFIASSIGLTLASACASAQTADSAAVVKAAPSELVATLIPGEARVTGFVKLRPADKSGQTRATVELRNGNARDEHPWQIRAGRCGEAGVRVGAQASYRSITIREDGVGTLTLTLPLELPDAATHSVTVSRSRSEVDRIVACGNLSVQSP